MNSKRIILSLLIATFCAALPAAATMTMQPQPPQGASPFTIDDLIVVRRVSDPQMSPDNRTVAYTVTDTDKTANKRNTQIYLMPLAGGESRQLTRGDASANSPRWSPDGRQLAFVSARDGAPQVWVIDVASGDTKKVTDLPAGISGAPVWSPDGSLIAVSADVYPECTTAECNRTRHRQAAESKIQAKISDRLLYRHWDSWKEGKRTHIFVVPSGGGGEARDLTPGDYDAPPFSLGGPDDYAFSPDSKELAFARNTDRVEAISTNGDIFTVPVTGGEARRITAGNAANDLSPQYSPDGRYLAYRAQLKPGFESDRWQLMLYDRQTRQSRSLTAQFDSSVESFVFAPDGRKIYVSATERGRQPIHEVPVGGGQIRKVLAGGYYDDLKITRDGKTFVFTDQSLARPVEIFRANADGTSVTQLTHINDAFLAKFKLPAAEVVKWEGAAGAQIEGFFVTPVNFTPSKKWPLIVLIHGGPQGAWNDSWSYRWNPQVFAGAGYAVFMPNPRGSTGYGQQFVDEISGDWAGKVYIDIMNGVAAVAARPYIDRARVGAAGGSYGGYMVNWIEGHNTDKRVQFKALVSHAGVYNLTSMAGATEELWFTDWEFKGTPWDNPELYERWSPHRFVKNFKTPMLVIHGELDYRVPVTEGLQLFTALQRRGVPSKLLIYPDEGHWILKPQNSELWYDTVIGWFDTYLKPKSQS